MAGSGPGGSNSGATGTILSGPVEPASDEAMIFFSDYNVPDVIAMLSSHSHYSVKEKIELFRKNLESFRKFPKEEPEEKDMQYGDEVGVVDEDDVEDDEDDEMEGEKGEREEIPKLMVDDNKLATDGQRQLPNENERECKKPRFAEDFGCQGEAECFI